MAPLPAAWRSPSRRGWRRKRQVGRGSRIGSLCELQTMRVAAFNLFPEFTVSDFIATLNYHSHVEADDCGHALTPPRQICREKVNEPDFSLPASLHLVVDGGIISKNPERGKTSTRLNRQEKHDLLDKAVFASAHEAQEFCHSYASAVLDARKCRFAECVPPIWRHKQLRKCNQCQSGRPSNSRAEIMRPKYPSAGTRLDRCPS